MLCNKVIALFLFYFLFVFSISGQNISVNTTGAAAAAANLFEVLQPSTTNNTVGIFASHSGAATNAYAIWAEATGGTNKYAIVVPSGGGSIGIGTTVPGALFHVSDGTSLAAAWPTANAQIISSRNGNFHDFAGYTASSSNVAHRTVFYGVRSRGTTNAPTVVVTNDYLLSFLASGYDGSAFVNPAAVDFFVDAAPSAGNVPARISFVTGTNGGNRTERLQIGYTGNIIFNTNQMYIEQATGEVGIGTTSPAALLHISVTGTPGVQIQKTDATARVWESRVSSAGNFVIRDITGAQDVLTITNLAAVQPGRIQANQSGSAAAPVFSFAGDANTGMYAPFGDVLEFATAGTARLTISASAGISSAGVPFYTIAGTAGAPSFSFGSDINTGVFNPGADIYAISTAGTERTRIDASGNFGIGVTPTALLHFKDGHVRSEQTTAPTIAVTTGNGITASAITAGSTDTKGNITTTGTNTTPNTVLTVTFNTAYTVAPTVVITAANDAGRTCTYFVSSTTTTFVLNFAGGTANPSFNYHVIE